MSIGTTPAVCEASIANVIPRFRHSAPISATGWIVPITLEPWLTITRRVLGRSRRATARGSTRPSRSTGTKSTSTPRSRAMWLSGRITELCSIVVETAWSPSVSTPWISRLSASVALAANTSRSGSLPPKKAVSSRRVCATRLPAARHRSYPDRPGLTPKFA